MTQVEITRKDAPQTEREKRKIFEQYQLAAGNDLLFTGAALGGAVLSGHLMGKVRGKVASARESLQFIEDGRRTGQLIHRSPDFNELEARKLLAKNRLLRGGIFLTQAIQLGVAAYYGASFLGNYNEGAHVVAGRAMKKEPLPESSEEKKIRRELKVERLTSTREGKR